MPAAGPSCSPRKPPVVLVNGRLQPANRPALRSDDRGLLVGLGLFETVRLIDARAPLWPAHRQRLNAGLFRLGIAWPEAVDRSLARLPELARRNDLSAGEAMLRLTVTAGPSDGEPVVLAQVGALSPRVHARRAGTRLISRGAPRALADLKSLAWLASAEALRGLPDDTEALILDGKTCLETASANLFAVFGNQVLTPVADGRILPGVARARVLHICAALGLDVASEALTRADLLRADEVWITNALLPLAPVLEVDGEAVGQTGLHHAVRRRYDRYLHGDEGGP